MEQIVINKDFIEQKLQQAEKLFWLAVMYARTAWKVVHQKTH